MRVQAPPAGRIHSLESTRKVVVRKFALPLAALLATLTLGTACSPMDDPETDGPISCPTGYVQLDLNVWIQDSDGNDREGVVLGIEVEERTSTPNYPGVIVDGKYVTPMFTAEDPSPWYPVSCYPADLPVALRLLARYEDPVRSYDTLKCTIEDPTVDGAVAGILDERKRRVELIDLIGLPYEISVQCSWLYVPPGWTGPKPDPFHHSPEA
jgi:hypothetical protein